MHGAARDQYLAAEVMTAPPQKLQLLLIDGAIRFIHQAMAGWNGGQNEAACDAVTRAQEIVAELIAGVRTERDPELGRKVLGVYLFVFRALVEANTRRSLEKLGEALRVLEVERGTWREVCQRLANGSSATPAVAPDSFTALSDLTA